MENAIKHLDFQNKKAEPFLALPE